MFFTKPLSKAVSAKPFVPSTNQKETTTEETSDGEAVIIENKEPVATAPPLQDNKVVSKENVFVVQPKEVSKENVFVVQPKLVYNEIVEPIIDEKELNTLIQNKALVTVEEYAKRNKANNLRQMDMYCKRYIREMTTAIAHNIHDKFSVANPASFEFAFGNTTNTNYCYVNAAARPQTDLNDFRNGATDDNKHIPFWDNDYFNGKEAPLLTIQKYFEKYNVTIKHLRTVDASSIQYCSIAKHSIYSVEV